MYVPLIFRPESSAAVRKLIQNYPFATLTGQAEGKLQAVHLPLLLVETESGEWFLEGHIAAGNNLQEALRNPASSLLAIFQGPHAYVSSSWYTHENVPTWNYMAAHVHGKPTVLSGEDLYQHLREMVDQYEEGRAQRFYLEQMNPKALAGQMKGIVGFRLAVEEVEATFKLSQNRNETDYGRIIAQLEASQDPLDQALAEAMKHSTQKK